MFKLTNKPISIIGVLVGILLVQACGRPLEEEASCNFVQNSRAQRVSWSHNTPAEIFIDSSVPAEFVPYIESAAQTWNETLGDELIRIRTTGGGGKATPSKDGVSKIYFMDTWDENKPTEQARTTVYWAGAVLYEADIRINVKNFEYFLDDKTRDYSKVHFESLILHELGHALGLAHNEHAESVMQAALANGKVRDEVQKVDKDSLTCEY